MKRLILTAIVLVTATIANAQAIEACRSGLSVREVGTAQSTIANYDAQRVLATVEGYRVRIFFDNKQTARASALAIQSQFDALYPTIPSYFAYESPNFIVMVGNFATREEAIALVGRIIGTFPKALLMHCAIPVGAFVSKK